MNKPATFEKTTRLNEIPVSWSLDDALHFEVLGTPSWLQVSWCRANLILTIVRTLFECRVPRIQLDFDSIKSKSCFDLSLDVI